MNRLSVCIIGCGDIGYGFDKGRDNARGALTHFKAFRDDKRFELKAVCDLNQKILNEIGSLFKIKTYRSYERMFKENQFDVYVVATDDNSHFEILKTISGLKPKIVFCEKPLAANYKSAKEIISIYDKKQIPLQVNYTRRFLKQFDDIEKMIRSKKPGELESVTMYYSRGLTHNASHYLDLLNRYIGETEKSLVKISVKKGIGDDDSVSFNMTYGGGTEVRFIGLSAGKLSFAEVDFVGSKGRIKINYRNEIEKYKVIPNKTFKGYLSYEMYECKRIEYETALPNAADNIYKFLNGNEKLKSPASNSVEIFKLIERIKAKKLCLN